MRAIDRITLDPDVMGGKPCVRGMRVTVGTILGLLAAGHSEDEILRAYPYLEREDIRAALSYATWRVCDVLLESIWLSRDPRLDQYKESLQSGALVIIDPDDPRQCLADASLTAPGLWSRFRDVMIYEVSTTV